MIIIFKIVLLILMTIPLIASLKLMYEIYYSFNRNKKIQTQMDEWSKFNEDLLLWGEEIKTPSIKNEYLHFCIDSLTIISQNDLIHSIKGEDNFWEIRNIRPIKEEIIRKYSDHIPSLKQEVRDKKINKILS